VDLKDCVRDALDGNQDFLARKHQAVRLLVPDEPVVARVDAVRITEMVSNLVSNASRYSPEGAAIEIRVERHDEKAEISVIDHGAGIEESRIARIFDAFVSGRNDGTGQGLGIGLWLTRRFAELHGGTVTARSAGPGQGAEFRIELPLGGGISAEAAVR
jgi:signal transduction histidine kinase